MRLISLLSIAGVCMTGLCQSEEACVTVNPSTGTYTVDPSGSVDRPRPKCDLKNHHKHKKKSLKKEKC